MCRSKQPRVGSTTRQPTGSYKRSFHPFLSHLTRISPSATRHFTKQKSRIARRGRLLSCAVPPPAIKPSRRRLCDNAKWRDSYDFVRLHQPASTYGVESQLLQPSEQDVSHRATRLEILTYYERVRQFLETKYRFCYAGGLWLDLDNLRQQQQQKQQQLLADAENGAMVCRLHACHDTADSTSATTNTTITTTTTIRVRKRVVDAPYLDARYLQPDLPVNTEPKFAYTAQAIRCIPVNGLARTINGPVQAQQRYVVIGGGKTGMDAVTYLLQTKGVLPDNIFWILPNDAWITAREKMGNCMEFLHTCCALMAQNKSGDDFMACAQSPEFFQAGFLEWEKQEKVYRLDESIIPTKFKDATLDKAELDLLRSMQKNIIRNGRIQKIQDDGTLQFEDGSTMSLPWGSAESTVFVHCSSGAFNYSKQPPKTTAPPPVFDRHFITIQEVCGTPGFCFVGSVTARIEYLQDKTDAEKNALVQVPQPSNNHGPSVSLLGPSGGDIIALSIKRS